MLLTESIVGRAMASEPGETSTTRPTPAALVGSTESVSVTLSTVEAGGAALNAGASEPSSEVISGTTTAGTRDQEPEGVATAIAPTPSVAED